MSDDTEDAKAKAERARRNLKRRARAAEFEAFEDAELRREEQRSRLMPESERVQPSQGRDGVAGGPASSARRKGLPTPRGK